MPPGSFSTPKYQNSSSLFLEHLNSDLKNIVLGTILPYPQKSRNSLGKNIKKHEMKNEKKTCVFSFLYNEKKNYDKYGSYKIFSAKTLLIQSLTNSVVEIEPLSVTVKLFRV